VRNASRCQYGVDKKKQGGPGLPSGRAQFSVKSKSLKSLKRRSKEREGRVGKERESSRRKVKNETKRKGKGGGCATGMRRIDVQSL